MKKIIYILLIAFTTSATLTSCTEEEITPTEMKRNSGGGISDPK